MYRKHLKEMEETNDGLKTIDKISKIPVVNSAITNATDYYVKVKDKNILLRTSCNLAELSLRTIAYAATPITAICKKPMQTVDSYLCEKVDQLESNYPIITKPTEQVTASAYSQVKEIYDKTLKPPIDTITNIKDTSFKTVSDMKSYGTNKVQDAVKLGTNSLDSLRLYSFQQLNKSAQYGFRIVDAVLEQKYAKMLATPLLDLTEKSISYFIPPPETNEENQLEKTTTTTTTTTAPTTLTRLYDINTRVARHVYQSTYNQILKLNLQFEYGIEKLATLNKFFTTFYENSKNKVCENVETNKNSLKALCSKYVDFENISAQKLEVLCRQSFKNILTDVNQTLHQYLDVLKNLPIASTGTKLKQFTTDLLQKLNKEPFPELLNSTIVQLRKIHNTLWSFIVRFIDPEEYSKSHMITKRNTNNNSNNNVNDNNKIANTIIKSSFNNNNNNNNNNHNSNNSLNNDEIKTLLFSSTIIEAMNKQKKNEQEKEQQQQKIKVNEQNNKQEEDTQFQESEEQYFKDANDCNSINNENEDNDETAEEDFNNDDENDDEEQTSNNYYSENEKIDDNYDLKNYSACTNNSDANKTQDLINTSTSSVASDSIHY